MVYFRGLKCVGRVVSVGLCLAGMVYAGGVREGHTRAQAVAIMGAPEREVQTSRGSVMFYGRTLIEVADGRVSYVSVTPGGSRRKTPKPVKVHVKVVGDQKAENPPPSEGSSGNKNDDPTPDEVTVHVGLPTPSGDAWRSFALEQNKLELVARLKRAVLMESYVVLFRPSGTVSKPYSERKEISCHDIRDKVGEPMKCYGQDLEIRDPALDDLKTESSLTRSENLR